MLNLFLLFVFMRTRLSGTNTALPCPIFYLPTFYRFRFLSFSICISDLHPRDISVEQHCQFLWCVCPPDSVRCHLKILRTVSTTCNTVKHEIEIKKFTIISRNEIEIQYVRK